MSSHSSTAFIIMSFMSKSFLFFNTFLQISLTLQSSKLSLDRSICSKNKSFEVFIFFLDKINKNQSLRTNFSRLFPDFRTSSNISSLSVLYILFLSDISKVFNDSYYATCYFWFKSASCNLKSFLQCLQSLVSSSVYTVYFNGLVSLCLINVL